MNNLEGFTPGMESPINGQAAEYSNEYQSDHHRTIINLNKNESLIGGMAEIVWYNAADSEDFVHENIEQVKEENVLEFIENEILNRPDVSPEEINVYLPA